MKFKKILAGVLAAVMVATSAQLPVMPAKAEEAKVEAAKDDLKIWYSSPAANSYTGWEQWALPLGNSGIGASVFGGVASDRIQLNEKSLWSGGPAAQRPNYMGGNIESQGQNGAVMAQVQQLMREGKTSQAVSLCNQLVGVSDDAGTQGYGYYLSYGNMYLNFSGVTDSNVTNYYRDLDLRTAVATVEYDYNGTHYTRETFVSYPDNVLVTHITADGSGDIDVEVSVQPDNAKGNGSNNPGSSSYSRQATTTVKNGLISVEGKLDDNQMKFASHTQVLADGTVTDKTSTVAVADAKEVTIITSIGTDYKNDYPTYRTGETDAEFTARVKNYVTKAVAKEYSELKADHIADYDNIFGRVELEIGQDVSNKTTDKLLAAYKNGTATAAEERYLEVMMFQYGRFLTIEASRETPKDDPYRETLPSNLQGMWVGANNSAWHSDYHMNVNLQMNYWPTYSTNMVECAEPLIDYVESLREPGRVTAKIYAGIESTSENPENGFMAHTQNNPFGWTCPGWSFDWGWSPAGVPWILQNCWEYYEYTGDVEYMKENIYPMLKEEAVFYDQLLVRNSDGELVSSPSYSPEQGPRTEGNTYEHSLIWQLYEDAMTAAEILGEDKDLAATWAANQADLKGPIEIGDSGQIKEWYNETTFNKDENGNNMGEGYNHRHISHMLGLFPGDLIQMNDTWVEAAKVSMENRTDNSTGWGMAQRICTWARLEDGNRAHKILDDLISQKILNNLWDTHPPFQIDGNYGLTAGVAEMLLQSNMGYIDLLPAVPDAWAEGSVEGLLARGNFEVDMAWSNGNLTEATILSKNGGECVVDYVTIANATVLDADGKEVEVKDAGDGRISFETAKGATYTITEIPVKPLEKLTIEGKDTINTNVTATTQLTAVYEPASSEGNGVKWSVDDITVAVIDANGILRAIKEGTVVVTATYKDDETKTATKTIEVVKAAPAAEAFDSAVLAKNAIANSEMNPANGSDGPASWAFDDADHWWHSRWGGWNQLQSYETVTQSMTGRPSASNPIWIQTGFGDSVYVDHIDYAPRSNGYGIFKDYKVMVANLDNPSAMPTDSDFTVVKTGTLSGTTNTQTIQLDEVVEATHVRIVVTSVTCAGDGHIAAKNIKIYGYEELFDPSATVSKKVLESAVDYAENFDEADYEADLWADFEAAVTAGEAVLAKASATQNEVYEATAAIYNAIVAFGGLELPTPEVTGAPQPTETEAPKPTETEAPTQKAEPIPVSEMTAAAGSEYTPEGQTADKLIDENQNTIWHTDWKNDTANRDNHWVTFELKNSYVVSGMQYLSRQDPGTSGCFLAVTLQTSEDGKNWEDATSVVFTNSTDWQEVSFDEFETTYIRMKVTNATTDNSNKPFAAGAEVRFIGYKVTAPVPTETEAPQPTETEAPVPTETEAPQPTETEAPQPTETPGETEEVTTVFDDVYNDWYKDYVQYVYDNGLMTGIKGTKHFAPNANITKAQVAQVLYNMETQPEVTVDKVFSDLNDVYDAEWYADAVAWAYNTGVVTGDLNTKKFNPNADVTREQLALMMFRYAKYKEYDVTATSDYEGLVNADKVNNWAAEGMSWAVGAGLISGIEKDGVKDLAPQGNASRAQVAAILQRFCENVAK